MYKRQKLATVPGTENVSDGLEQAATALHLSVDRNAAMEKGLTVAQVYMAVASALTDTDSSLSLTLDGLDVSVSIQSPEESRMTREKLMDLEIDPSAMSAMSSMMSAASGSGGTAPCPPTWPTATMSPRSPPPPRRLLRR